MKKYTDTELLEKLLSMLHYFVFYSSRADAVSILDIVDFKILESSGYVSESFVVALQNRINELAKKAGVEATNIIVNEDSKFSEKYKQYFNEERPLAEDCMRCKLREQCQNANMMTIEPRCLINGASLRQIKVDVHW